MSASPPVRLRRVHIAGFLRALAARWGTSIWCMPALVVFVFGGAGGLLGGIVTSRVASGPDGLRDLGRRIVDPTHMPAAGGPWSSCSPRHSPQIAAALAHAFGEARPLDLGGTVSRLNRPPSFTTMTAFTLVAGPLPEEIGWRGYLLEQVQVQRSALLDRPDHPRADVFARALVFVWTREPGRHTLRMSAERPPERGEPSCTS